MTALQWVIGRSVVLHGEEGGLPTLHVVARGTLAAILTLGELAVVGVLVAIRALLERDLLLEITIGMALAAGDLLVLAYERILRFGVVEALRNVLQGDLLPSGGGVA